VGREPEDASAWTEVDRLGLSVVRCPTAVDQDGAWSGRWSGAGFGWSRVLSRGEPSLGSQGGVVLSGQCSAAHGIDLGQKLGWMLTIEGAPRRCTWVEKNQRRGLGPMVAGAAAGFGEQRGSVVELMDVAAVPDGDWSELPSGRQQWLRAAPNGSLRWCPVLGAEGCGYLVQGRPGMRPKR
jgi:hypothetical protein